MTSLMTSLLNAKILLGLVAFLLAGGWLNHKMNGYEKRLVEMGRLDTVIQEQAASLAQFRAERLAELERTQYLYEALGVVDQDLKAEIQELKDKIAMLKEMAEEPEEVTGIVNQIRNNIFASIAEAMK